MTSSIATAWHRLAAIVLAIPLLGPLPALAQEETSLLPFTADQAIAAATASGLLDGADFQAVDDPYVGPIVVGRPAAEDGVAVSVLLMGPGESPYQVQIVLQKPWGDLAAKMTLAGNILALVGAMPEPNPAVAAAEKFSGLPRQAQWAVGLLTEAWAGWPGSTVRQVRVVDGVAIIAEGYPPDYWVLTLAPDRGYADATWPGLDPAADTPAVAQARLAIRSGDYTGAHALLRDPALEDDAAAQSLLGDMFRFGRLGQADQQIAANYYLRAGRVRYPPAVYALATMANEGYGVLTLDALRYPLLIIAAENDSADALFMLSDKEEGVFFQRPEGVGPVEQVEMAARLGLLAAQVDLASRYARGEGIDPDPVAAYAWALVALDNTEPGVDWIRSRELADTYSQGLTGKQRADAHELAARLIAEIDG
ncbi:MAG: tetratricopeptide repeat protein [Proteobacteria bacterium]|nr:tetratricopeptide repeat protein [Pseudomonadota bacterium]